MLTQRRAGRGRQYARALFAAPAIEGAVAFCCAKTAHAGGQEAAGEAAHECRDWMVADVAASMPAQGEGCQKGS